MRSPQVLQASGKVTGVRLHDVGAGYGPPSDEIDGEAVFWLETPPSVAFDVRDGGGPADGTPTPTPAPAAPAPNVPPHAFGSKLRNDANALTHQVMRELLRVDADGARMDGQGSGQAGAVDTDAGNERVPRPVKAAHDDADALLLLTNLDTVYADWGQQQRDRSVIRRPHGFGQYRSTQAR